MKYPANYVRWEVIGYRDIKLKNGDWDTLEIPIVKTQNIKDLKKIDVNELIQKLALPKKDVPEDNGAKDEDEINELEEDDSIERLKEEMEQ